MRKLRTLRPREQHFWAVVATIVPLAMIAFDVWLWTGGGPT
jgi:hypothetical protein